MTMAADVPLHAIFSLVPVTDFRWSRSNECRPHRWWSHRTEQWIN